MTQITELERTVRFTSADVDLFLNIDYSRNVYTVTSSCEEGIKLKSNDKSKVTNTVLCLQSIEEYLEKYIDLTI